MIYEHFPDRWIGGQSEDSRPGDQIGYRFCIHESNTELGVCRLISKSTNIYKSRFDGDLTQICSMKFWLSLLTLTEG